MLALDLAHDTTDNAGTDFRILRQLADDVAEEFAAFVRQNCRTLPRAPWEVPVMEGERFHK
jgi:hypothetical protein